MESLGVLYYHKLSEAFDMTLKVDYPYARRLSPLQKITLKNWIHFQDSAADIYSKWTAVQSNPLFFTSTYGEIQSIVNVASSIIDNELPVSPVAFQHSVDNAAIGHCAIYSKFHNPTIAFPGESMGVDQLIFHGQFHLKSHKDSMVCILKSDEVYEGHSFTKLESEILVLSLDPTHTFERKYEINDLKYQYESSQDERINTPYLNLKEQKFPHVRSVNCDRGRCHIQSKWTKGTAT